MKLLRSFLGYAFLFRTSYLSATNDEMRQFEMHPAWVYDKLDSFATCSHKTPGSSFRGVYTERSEVPIGMTLNGLARGLSQKCFSTQMTQI